VNSTNTSLRVPHVLYVGVTGHRPDPSKRTDPDILAIRACISEVLRLVQETVNGVADARGNLFAVAKQGDSPRIDRRLFVISALASGADQWVADEGLKLGYELQCSLPFAREEYRKDFDTPTDVMEYDRLLSLATVVLELDGMVETVQGVRQPDSRAYEAVGRAVLNQSDLLIAIWDEKPSHGLGGTGFIVHEALERGLSVIIIPWGSPLTWKLRTTPDQVSTQAVRGRSEEERLSALVREVLHSDRGMSRLKTRNT